MQINESPKIVGPEKITKKVAGETYARLLSAEILGQPYKNADLVRKGREYAVLDHEKKEITYYMEYREKSFGGHRTVFQNFIWRNLTVPELAGLPTKVFFEYLLPIHGKIVTDQVQTDFGKGFWRNAIGVAISKGLHVYFFDLNKKERPTEIKDQSDFDAVVDLVWGSGEPNRWRLVMISKEKLKGEIGTSLDDFGVPN